LLFGGSDACICAEGLFMDDGKVWRYLFKLYRVVISICCSQGKKQHSPHSAQVAEISGKDGNMLKLKDILRLNMI
jgi:hypothetical protein